MSTEYRRLLTLLENMDKPGWLTGSIFKNKLLRIANETGWVPVQPGSKLYTVLLGAVSSRISRERGYEGLPTKLNDSELMFFQPRRQALKEYQEQPITDLSAANDVINRIKTATKNQSQEEPDTDVWYLLVDLVATRHYNFYLYKTSDGRWDAPGSPGFSGGYWYPKNPDPRYRFDSLLKVTEEMRGVFYHAKKK